MDLSTIIRTVPDFPKPGIGFKDITPILRDPAAFDYCLRQLLESCPLDSWDGILGIESRGFIFGAALAQMTHRPFAPARKPGKLPWRTHTRRYQLEYGEDALQIHQDAFAPGDRVLIVDDLLATGGTLLAAAALVRDLGAVPVAAACVIELGFLNGRRRLQEAKLPFHCLLCVEAE